MKRQIFFITFLITLIAIGNSYAQNFNATQSPYSQESPTPKEIAKIVMGISASTVVNLIALPQIYTILKSGNAKGLSLVSQGVGLFGFALWTTYGALSHDYIIIVSSSVGAALQVILMILTWKYKKITNIQIQPEPS